MSALTWRHHEHGEGFVAESRRVPEQMAGAYYWIQDDHFNPGGPDRDPGWSLQLVTHDGDKHHETHLGHHTDPDVAKAAAQRYETTGVTPAEARPSDEIVIVITYNAPDPGQRDPHPQAVRDNHGRVRVYDEASDRYGWAALDITWEAVAPPSGDGTDREERP